MRAVGIIPARWDSTRFPGKPLADIAGKPMIQWVYERAQRAALLSQVIVATDDERIEEAVRAFGGEVAMTPRHLASGTDRVALVARDMPVEIVVNIQGDEPLIEPAAIDQAVRLLIDDPEAVVGTLAREVKDPAELADPNTVRVVLDRKGYALYFSRAAIPFVRDCSSPEEWLKRCTFYNHIGLYVFRRSFLLKYATLPQTPLEQAEKLEQLRVLEHGYRIRVGITNSVPLCVDTPEDLERVREEVRRRGW
ncbi:MAG: 3-deoxy-manno-octulosonate cytidylyltransferase [candidate division KSB1 bacterium]|nr:3-deoxy-manno-octulosonate cytidylyltransferase [candidate division KSB1 bacterium]MDZ7295361.1 3-deoxy-manno-octulosonate cytidylyltransferase [candidate division KSB1 bacterium]MDZ7338742.1 3-deoxy-manno-octulosonate cytidylyltransferase [candidate division KSB1 bacterium]MDZ7378117.1 3-deoxy-manno-octulosonate cytidylyltransferase [candidate division KSB1 bacterium]MDZ7385110.1 3-deoxy-manno-octulosonate cytidylyltransferase [candidate division KSB1 bacterium]